MSPTKTARGGTMKAIYEVVGFALIVLAFTGMMISGVLSFMGVPAALWVFLACFALLFIIPDTN